MLTFVTVLQSVVSRTGLAGGSLGAGAHLTGENRRGGGAVETVKR